MEPASHHLVVPRTARYETLGTLEGQHLEEVWLLLHGYGQLASELLGYAGALARENRLLIAPEALSRFYHEDHRRVGASWMTREDRLREIEDYVRYLDLLHDDVFAVVSRSAVRLRVLGFSQGAATAARWAVGGKGEVDELVLWGSPLPPELDDDRSMTALSAMKVVLVGGARDPFLGEKEWREQRSRLSRHGVHFEERTFEGGHRLDDDTLRALA